MANGTNGIANFDRRRLVLFIAAIIIGLLIIGGIIAAVFHDRLFPSNTATTTQEPETTIPADNGTNGQSAGNTNGGTANGTTAPQPTASAPSTTTTPAQPAASPSTGPTDALTLAGYVGLLAAGSYAAAHVVQARVRR